MRILNYIFRTLIVLVVAAIAFAYSGIYDISAGSGHSAPVAWYLETLRERSIESRAEELVVPGDLADAGRVQAGAGHYSDACALCHGSPLEDSSRAFDPAPPALHEHPVEAAEAFWVVKNGIKMTAMPRHDDHSDEDLWNIVAFLQALPELSAHEYRKLTAGAEHRHGHDGTQDGKDEASDDGQDDGHGHHDDGEHDHSGSEHGQNG